jgi:hypothetical protein
MRELVELRDEVDSDVAESSSAGPRNRRITSEEKLLKDKGVGGSGSSGVSGEDIELLDE